MHVSEEWALHPTYSPNSIKCIRMTCANFCFRTATRKSEEAVISSNGLLTDKYTKYTKMVFHPCSTPNRWENSRRFPDFSRLGMGPPLPRLHRYFKQSFHHSFAAFQFGGQRINGLCLIAGR